MAAEHGPQGSAHHPEEPPADLSAIPIIRPSSAVAAARAQDQAGSPDAGQGVDTGADSLQDLDPNIRSVADLEAPAPARDTPITQPPASEPVPLSVLAPADPEPVIGQPVELGPPGRRRDRVRFSSGAALRRIMHSAPLHTQTMPLISRLQSSPYAHPYLQAEREATDDVRRTLDFALRMGETMFRFGAGSLEVETSIVVICQAYGIRETEVDITAQSMSLNYAPKDQLTYTVQRVVRSWSQNYAGLARLHRLVSSIARGEIGRDEAIARLDEVRHRPKPYPKWVATLAGACFAATFVLYIGGSPVGAGVSLLSTLLVLGVIDLMDRMRVPEFFSIMAGGFMATTVALVLYALDVPLSPAIVVAGGLMMLLPSSRFVSAVQDAINGFPVTAAGRLVSTALTYVAIVAGILVAVVASDLVGAPPLDLAQETQAYLPVTVLGVLVVVAAALDAVVEQSEARLILPTALVSLCGFGVHQGMVALGAGAHLPPAVAAVVIGALGRYTALRMGAPQVVVAVPGILFLLPGLMIFRSMYEVAMSTGAVLDGLVGMFSAAMVIMAIAAGVVLGDTLARPFTKAYRANERRPRARRR